MLEKIGWTGGEAITDGRALRPLLPHHARTAGSPSAGAAAGSRWAPALHGRAEVDADVVAAQRRHLLEYFPDLAGRRITHAWGGPIDASPTHLPAVTSLPRGRAWVAAGYTGNGVGPTNMVGRTLASLALDRSDEPTRLAFVDAEIPRVPPSPSTGSAAKRSASASPSKEDAELEGRTPGPIASAIAKVPELIGFHIGR